MKENLALSFYPVSLEQIQEKVERKQIRQKNKIMIYSNSIYSITVKQITLEL